MQPESNRAITLQEVVSDHCCESLKDAIPQTNWSQLKDT